MKKNWLLLLGLLVVVLSVGVYGFVTGVSNQLWQASMRTIIESTHQGANALNVQFERDFEDLEQIWRQLAQAEPEAREEMLRYYQAVDPDLRFYQAKRQQGGDKKATGYLSALREEQLAGLVPSHINSLTGENVFNMFVQGRLADGNLAYLVKEYRTREIANQFTLSFYDQTGFSYLVDQRGNISLAIGSGQLFGQGYLNGVQTQSPSSQALPARHTDFIYAVCGEELGLVGCMALLLLLSLIVLRCIWVGRHASSPFNAYVCMGMAGMLLAQITFNVGMCLFILPVMGLTLPFISYGGSSIITLFAAMGIVSSVKARTLPSWLRDRSPV